MKTNQLGRLLVGLAFGSTSALAIPVFQSGTAGFIFDPGDGNLTSVTANPIPGVGPVTQLSASNPAPLQASGAAGMWHGESANHFGLSLPGGTGVSQFDTSNNPHDPATVTINFTATWEMNGQFGPTAFGYANFPLITGVVGAGAGSFVRLEIDATFTGGATRSPISFDYLNSNPGPFSTSFYNEETLTPNFIGDGLTETISGVIRFSARGVEDLSEISLGTVSGTTPVPEPEEWAAGAGVALLAFGVWRRRA